MSVSVLIEAVEVEGFGGDGVVAPTFGDVQVAVLFDSRDDGGADGGQVGGPAAGTAGGGSSLNVVSLMFSRGEDRCKSGVLADRAGSGVVVHPPSPRQVVVHVAGPRWSGF